MSDLPSLATPLLRAVAQLSRLFVCLLSLLFLPKDLRCESFVVVGGGIVGVQVDGLLKGGERSLVSVNRGFGTL